MRVISSQDLELRVLTPDNGVEGPSLGLEVLTLPSRPNLKDPGLRILAKTTLPIQYNVVQKI